MPGPNVDPLSGRDVIADNTVGGTAEQEASPQFNYRQVGEPETLGYESKEIVGGPDQDAWDGGVQGSHVKTRTQHGLSEYAGMSEPKTLKELDDENTWTSART